MFLQSFAVGFSGAATPGPMLLVTIAESARSGAIAAVMIVAGHAFLEIIATAGLGLGLLSLAGKPGVVAGVSLAGALYLGYIAIQTLREAFLSGGLSVGVAAAGRPTGRNLLRLFGIGILVSAGNPYWAVWWLAVAPGLLTGALTSPASQVPAFYIGHELADFVWYFAVGVGASSGSRFLGGRIYRWMLGGCGIFLVFFAGYFMLKAIKAWFL